MNNNIEHTLLSINQSLKEKSNLRKKKNKYVFRIWTKKKNVLEFQSEASTLNFFNDKWPKNKCPYCEEYFGKKDITKSDDKSWLIICPGCKSFLTVLNE